MYLKGLGISTWIYYHEKYLDAMYKKNERLRHLYITAIRFLADELYRRGVRKLYIGYPIMLSQNNGNKYNTNIWWYKKIVLWIVDIFRDYGIEVEIVPEDYTSNSDLIDPPLISITDPSEITTANRLLRPISIKASLSPMGSLCLIDLGFMILPFLSL
jgi:hypothetical protein